MLKNISNLGRNLNKTELKSISGGFAYTFFIEGDRHCLDCSQPITSEDNPTAAELQNSGCRVVNC